MGTLALVIEVMPRKSQIKRMRLNIGIFVLSFLAFSMTYKKQIVYILTFILFQHILLLHLSFLHFCNFTGTALSKVTSEDQPNLHSRCISADFLLIPLVSYNFMLWFPDSSPVFWRNICFFPLPLRPPPEYGPELTGTEVEGAFHVNYSKPQLSSPVISPKFTFYVFIWWSPFGFPISTYIVCLKITISSPFGKLVKYESNQ